MTSLEWIQMEKFGNEISPYSHNSMGYYNDCLYMTSGNPSYEQYFRFYKYCLENQMWIKLTNANETKRNRAYHSGFIYNGYFYGLSGEFKGFLN